MYFLIKHTVHTQLSFMRASEIKFNEPAYRLNSKYIIVIVLIWLQFGSTFWF